MAESSQVTDFYSGKNVFITGGTGFLGICLIEKLLRSVPDIGKLYLLLRPKKGKQIEDRLQEITKNAIFEKFLETNSPDAFNKLIPISGEISEEGMALSTEDRALLKKEVHVVFHSAATLDFQQNLRPTVAVNLLGTRRVMDLCKEMENLKVLIHVSSAFVNSFLLSCEEILYPAPEDAEKVIGLATTLTDNALEALEATLLKDHPNTYTFTKHLAEHEVAKCAHLFPCTIVRPSMITGAWKEPVPGWTISKNGPQGFLMGASKGVVRRLPLAKGLISDYIPVDVVVNELIVAGYRAATDKGPLTIYHCTSSTVRPFMWASVETKVNEYLHKYPLKSAVWYPHLKFVSSIWLFKLSAIFVHFIPAYILDTVTRISGGRPILVRLHTNVNSSLKRLERFIFTEWKFHNPKTMELNKTLNVTDKIKYQIDISTLQWEDYFNDLTLGVRRYLSKEPISTLKAGKKRDGVLLILHILLQAAMYFSIWTFVAMYFDTPFRKCAWVLPVAYIILGYFI